MMRFYWLLLAVLAVWRITHLFHAEDGPWNLLTRFRERLRQGFFGSLLDCFYCLSLWIAAPFAYFLGESAGEQVLLWLALSGGASLLERISRRPDEEPFYEEDE